MRYEYHPLHCERGRRGERGGVVVCKENLYFVLYDQLRELLVGQSCTTQCQAEEGKEGALGSRSRAAFCNQPAPPAPLTGAPPLLVIVIVIYINIIMHYGRKYVYFRVFHTLIIVKRQ